MLSSGCEVMLTQINFPARLQPQVEVTYAEGLALSVEPAPGPAAKK